MPRTMTPGREQMLREIPHISEVYREVDSERDVSKALAEALEEAKRLLDTAPMSQPYNDRSNRVRVQARAALARYKEGQS